MVDYSEFVAEVDRQTGEYFEQLPHLAPGTSRLRVEEVAADLLRRGVEPYRTLELVAAWNEVRAKPPMARSELIRTVDGVAAGLAEVSQ